MLSRVLSWLSRAFEWWHSDTLDQSYISRRNMGGQPLSVLHSCLPLLQHALPVPFSLDNNQIRNNTTTAHVALREALANSLIHAAYTVRGNIVIDRYFDRIVLSNPGTMLVSMEEYYEGGHSVCRNPVIQRCLYSWELVRKVVLVLMLLWKDGRIMVGAYPQLKKE